MQKSIFAQQNVRKNRFLHQMHFCIEKPSILCTFCKQKVHKMDLQEKPIGMGDWEIKKGTQQF